MWFLAAVFIVSACVAAVIGHWWTLALPLVALGVFYAGVYAGWWGNGFGDNWELALAIAMLVGVVGAALGVSLRTRSARAS